MVVTSKRKTVSKLRGFFWTHFRKPFEVKPFLVELPTAITYQLRGKDHTYVTYLWYRPELRKYDRTNWVESTPRVWNGKHRYWTTFIFETLPGLVLEARLESSTQEYLSYFLVTKRRGIGREFPHLKPITKQQAHQFSIQWAKRKKHRWHKFKHIPAYLRLRIRDRDDDTCQICGAQDKIHLDHIISQYDGGATSYQNLWILCARHNQEKSVKRVHSDELRDSPLPPEILEAAKQQLITQNLVEVKL
jgi:5-methylcytosine-specific restriction endonuclease McrA